MKKFTLLAVFLVLAIELIADTEPNNNQGQANSIMLGQKISGTMTGTDNEDWYVIDLPAGGSFNLNVTKHGDASFMIQIWDGILPNTIISALFMPFTVNPLDMDHLVKQLGPGRYYIRLLRNTSVGFYEIEAQVIPPAFGNDPEMNESFETAIEIPLDGSVSGTFGYYHSGTGHDKADWYTYTQDKAGTVEFTINKVGPGAANLTNQDSSSSNKIILNNLFMPQNMNSPPEGWVMETHALQGTYFVGIIDFNNAPLDYKITTKFIPPKWNEDREPNDLRVNLDTFASNIRIEGLLGYHKAGKGKDVADNYYLDVKKPSNLSLSLMIDRNGSGNIRLKSDEQILKSEFFNETNIDKALKVNQTVEPGIYLLELEYASGVFGYRVDVYQLEAPEADFKYKRNNNTLAFENLTNAEQANHSWNFDDGSPTVNTVNPIHTYATPGVYNVCLKSVNPAGTSEMCKKISIEGVSRIHPKEGGNTGDVTIHIIGGGFDNDFIVRLIKNGTIIKEVNAILKNSGTLAVNFDLRGTEEGPVDVEISKPGGPNYRIQNGFNIAKGSKPDTWARLTGRNRILKNTFTTYNLEIGNNGNVDATVVPFYIMIKNSDDTDLKIEPSLFFNFEDDGNEEFNPEYTIVNIKTDKQNSYRLYSFLVPLIRPGGTESFKIKIKSAEDVDVVVWTEKAWYQSPVNENKLNCIKDNYLENLEFINTLFDEKITEPQLECFFFTFTEELDKIKLINSTRDNLTHSRFIVNYLKTIAKTFKKCGIQDNEFRNFLIQLSMDYILNLAVRHGIPSNRNICVAEFESENMQTNQITAVSSFDPNEKSGYHGWGENNYHVDLQTIPYTIYFENQSNATAPAHVVSITDTLDQNIFDLSTFRPGPVEIGDSIITPTGAFDSFLADYFLPVQNVTVRISASLDTMTGIATWVFQSLDPLTLDITEDPDQGFLPPNILHPQGQGSVSFTIDLKHKAEHDLQIENKATIIFDSNIPIVTNIFYNSFDLFTPQSRVTGEMSSDKSTISLEWTGTDSGSGISTYNIYMSVNGGQDTLLLSGTSASKLTLPAESGNVYRFYSRARDYAGNFELKNNEYDVEISTVSSKDLSTSKPLVYPNPVRDYVHFRMARTENVRLIIYRTDGKQVWNQDLGISDQFNVRVDQFGAGVYFWNLINPITYTSLAIGKMVIQE